MVMFDLLQSHISLALYFVQIEHNHKGAEMLEKMIYDARQERDQWRECAEKLARAFEDVPHDPFTIGWSNAENCEIALAEFGWMKEDSK